MKVSTRHTIVDQINRPAIFSIGCSILLFLSISMRSFAQVNGGVYPPTNPNPQVKMGANAQDITNRANHAQSGTMPDHSTRQRQAEEIKRESRKQLSVPKTTVSTTPRPRIIQYEFPTISHLPDAAGYRAAYNRLLQMAADSSQFSLREAVYLTETAFYNEQGNYAEFQHGLELVGMFLEKQMQLSGYNPESNLAKNLMLFRFFADTLRRLDGSIYHLPFEYDFDDYRGDKDWEKMFVLKLLRENSGQCHSLPLFYLMLAEQIGAEAYLAYAPEHTYVKFALPNGGFQNVELTSQSLTTNAHVMQSGYIKAEALQSQIYMQPLTQKELLSHCLTDLAQGYLVKFGGDPYARKIIEKAIELSPKNIYAQSLLSDYFTLRFQFVVEQIGETEPTLEQWLKRYPRAAGMYHQMHETYDKIDAMGYAEMPAEAYEEWLRFMAEEKNNQENQQHFLKLEKSALER